MKIDSRTSPFSRSLVEAIGAPQLVRAGKSRMLVWSGKAATGRRDQILFADGDGVLVIRVADGINDLDPQIAQTQLSWLMAMAQDRGLRPRALLLVSGSGMLSYSERLKLDFGTLRPVSGTAATAGSLTRISIASAVMRQCSGSSWRCSAKARPTSTSMGPRSTVISLTPPSSG